MHPVAQQLNVIRNELNDAFVERATAIEAMLLTVLSKQHCHLHGPPGTGKSEMIRELIARFMGASYFECLLSKNRPDAAVMGPYDMLAFRELSAFIRKDAGFLTSVNFAFIDEATKMSPTLGHDMLAALNERIKHEVNGTRSAHPIPLYSAFTAGNERFADASDEAQALEDRLLVKVDVDNVVAPANFLRLLEGNVGSRACEAAGRTTVEFSELADVIDHVVPEIEVPYGALELAGKIRDQLYAKGIAVSNRRWVWAMNLPKAMAFLAGSDKVEDDHLQALRFALWTTPEDRAQVDTIVLSVANPSTEVAIRLSDECEKVVAEVRSRKGESLDKRSAYGMEASGNLAVMKTEAMGIRQHDMAAGRSVTRLDEVLARIEQVKQIIVAESMDLA